MNQHINELVMKATLNIPLSIKEINKQIKAMGRDEGLAALTIKVNINQTFAKTLREFIKQTKGLSEALENQNKVTQKTVQTFQKADGTIEKVTTTVKANQEVWKQMDKSQGKAAENTVEAAKKQVQSAEAQRKSLADLQKDLSNYEKTSERVRKNGSGQTLGYTHSYQEKDTGKKVSINTDANGMINNYSKLDDYLKSETLAQKKIDDARKGFEARDKAHYKALRDNQEFDLKKMQDNNKRIEILDKAHYRALKDNATFDARKNTALIDRDKLHYQALKENQSRDLKLMENHNKRVEIIDKAHYRALRDNQERDLKSMQDISKRREMIDKAHYKALQDNGKFDQKRIDDSIARDKLHYKALEENAKFDQRRIDEAIARDKMHYQALQENAQRDFRNNQTNRQRLEAIDKAHYKALEDNAKFDQKVKDGIVARDKMHYKALEDNRKFDERRAASTIEQQAKERDARIAANQAYQKQMEQVQTATRKHADVMANLNQRMANAQSQYGDNKQLKGQVSALNSALSRVGNAGSLDQKTASAGAFNKQLAEFETYAKSLTGLQNKIKDAEKTFGKNANISRQLATMRTELAGLDGPGQKATATIAGLGTRLNNLTAGMSRTQNGFKVFDRDIMSTIGNMARFQIAIAALYAPLQAFSSIISNVINIDTQMTQLNRVMDESANIQKVLQNNIQIANELGRSIQEVNENAIGFARMGFDENQTADLTKTATLLQNISDLNTTESVDTLTAGMTVFNIEASKAIDIADKLNEVKCRPPHTVMCA